MSSLDTVWDEILDLTGKRSYTYLPDKVREYAKLRAEINFGRTDHATAAFVEAALWHCKRREWDHVNSLLIEYRAVLNQQYGRYGEEWCPNCAIPQRDGKWICFRCKRRRQLVDEVRMELAEARIAVAWNDWREAIGTVKHLAKDRDGVAVLKMSKRAAHLVSMESEYRHKTIDFFVEAIEWMVDGEFYDAIWEFARKLLLIFSDLSNEQICGAKCSTCMNFRCKFKYKDEYSGHWVCPNCGKPRLLCMDSFTNQLGRCPRHTGRDHYYGFVDHDLSEAYEQYVNDPDLVSTQQQIALLDTRIGQLTASMDGLDPATLKEKLDVSLSSIDRYRNDLEIAMDEDEPDAFEVAGIVEEMLDTLSDIQGSTESAAAEQRNWDEIQQLLKGRKDQVDSEVKKQIAQQYTIPISTYIQTMTELAQMFVKRLALVTDVELQNKIRGLIAADTQRLLSGETVDGEYIMVEDDA